MSGKIVLLAGAAALLPAIAGQVAAQPSELAARPFAPPESPLVLTRTVWRTLADGKEIVVRRRYAVRFSRQEDGFTLEGRLLDASVEAPPMLAALADIERQRSDAGLFPMRLDGAGRIRPGTPAESAPAVRRESAVAQAHGMLAASPLTLTQRQESGTFLRQLAAQGAAASWPVDLFNPTSAERVERRRISLPGGQEGEVAVSVKALGLQADGLPSEVERTVTTVLAGTARTSRERWTLSQVELPRP